MKRESKNNSRQYFIISLVLMLLSNRVLFDGARLFNENLRHWDLRLPLDARIPFLPWTILIYAGCGFWWLYIYWLISQRNRPDADRFFAANLLSKAVSFLVFVLFPTAVTRPELGGESVWISLLRILYVLDKPDNVFPSIHCVLGWFCWIGVREEEDIPFPCRFSSLLMAVAVCLSTLTVRQHVLLDVAGGILLSEICYWAAGCEKLGQCYASFANSILTGTGRIKEKLMIIPARQRY